MVSLSCHLLLPEVSTQCVGVQSGESHDKELCIGAMPGGSPAAPVPAIALDPHSLPWLGRAERGFGFSRASPPPNSCSLV